MLGLVANSQGQKSKQNIELELEAQNASLGWIKAQDKSWYSYYFQPTKYLQIKRLI